MIDIISERITHVCVAGALGNLGKEVLRSLVESQAYCVSFDTNGTTQRDEEVPGVGLITSHNDSGFIFDTLEDNLGKFMVVDCTTRSQAEAAEAFMSRGIPAIMLGTNGQGESETEASLRKLETKFPDALLVRCPNAAAPIAWLLNRLGSLAEDGDPYAKALTGLTATVSESHQEAKKTTPGTARAFHAALEAAGAEVGKIHSERNPEVQRREWMVPRAYLGGHGYHHITVTSPTGGLEIEINTRVNGRRPYAEGLRDVILPSFIKEYLSGNRGLHAW